MNVSLFAIRYLRHRVVCTYFLTPSLAADLIGWWAQTRITLQRTAFLYAEHGALRFDPDDLRRLGGLKWTRTTDLALIRRAL